jgi:hypothetical protein
LWIGESSWSTIFQVYASSHSSQRFKCWERKTSKGSSKKCFWESYLQLCINSLSTRNSSIGVFQCNPKEWQPHEPEIMLENHVKLLPYMSLSPHVSISTQSKTLIGLCDYWHLTITENLNGALQSYQDFCHKLKLDNCLLIARFTVYREASTSNTTSLAFGIFETWQALARLCQCR